MVLRKVVLVAIFIFYVLLTGAWANEPILGFYAFPDRKYIDLISNTPFQFLIPYGMDGKEKSITHGFLDYAASKDVKIIFSVKDSYKGSKWYPKIEWCPTFSETELLTCLVKEFGGHKAVYGWYLADEPTWTVKTLLHKEAQLKANAGILKQYSTKPIFVEDFSLSTKPKGELWDYLTEFSDVLMTTSYPVPDKNISEVYDVIKGLTSKYKNAVVAVIQSFGKYQYPHYKKDAITGRPPTLAEVKVMSYLAFMAGAKGIMYYSLHDLEKLPSFQKRFEEMKGLSNELINNYPIVSSSETLSIEVKPSEYPFIYYSAKRYKNSDYLIAVNPTNKSFKEIAFLVNGKSVVLTLAPLEVVIRLLR